MRLSIVIYNVRGGGSTWAAVTWANAWSKAGHDVTIFAIQPQDGEGEDFLLHEDISVKRMDLSDKAASNSLTAGVRLLHNGWRLRRAIVGQNSDVIIAFDGPINVRTLLACYGISTPVIVMEQTHPGQYDIGEFWGKCRKIAYPGAAALVNLTKTASDWCEERFTLKQTAVIPNPVLPVKDRADHGPKERRVVIAAGRLVDQKGFDMLVPAFASIADKHPDWDLVIHGEGPNRADLERQINAAGLTDRILLPGWAENLSECMAKGDYFVLSSRYEGFGNVLVEALAVGLPAVSFDCPSGPGDIIRHEIDGLLVAPMCVEGLAEAMSRVMSDNTMRAQMGEEAQKVIYRFSVERTMALWDNLFDKVL